MTSRFFWPLGVATTALFAFAAYAQTQSAGEASRPVTPSRSAGPSTEAAPPKEDASIDWQAVRARIAETRQRDETFDRQMATGQTATRTTPRRPDGLRVLSPRQLERVDEKKAASTRVPLLAPVTGDTFDTLRVAARENAYTAIADLPGGAQIELLGTRKRVVGGSAEAIKARQTERRRKMGRLQGLDAPYIVSRHEEGVELSFSVFNVAYQISISCPDPDADPRCANDDYILNVAQNLSILNEEAGDGQ